MKQLSRTDQTQTEPSNAYSGEKVEAKTSRSLPTAQNLNISHSRWMVSEALRVFWEMKGKQLSAQVKLPVGSA